MHEGSNPAHLEASARDFAEAGAESAMAQGVGTFDNWFRHTPALRIDSHLTRATGSSGWWFSSLSRTYGLRALEAGHYGNAALPLPLVEGESGYGAVAARALDRVFHGAMQLTGADRSREIKRYIELLGATASVARDVWALVEKIDRVRGPNNPSELH